MNWSVTVERSDEVFQDLLDGAQPARWYYSAAARVALFVRPILSGLALILFASANAHGLITQDYYNYSLLVTTLLTQAVRVLREGEQHVILE